MLASKKRTLEVECMECFTVKRGHWKECNGIFPNKKEQWENIQNATHYIEALEEMNGMFPNQKRTSDEVYGMLPSKENILKGVCGMFPRGHWKECMEFYLVKKDIGKTVWNASH